jgi:adenine-specific DNA-methyltransferase
MQMSARISYMGTKQDLAGHVSKAIGGCRPGRLLDVFAGMGAVAEAHAGKRQVWTNDVQEFAYLASKCRFTDPAGPPKSKKFEKAARRLYDENMTKLREQNARAWSQNEKLCRSNDFETFEKHFSSIEGATFRHRDAYGCFMSRYSNAYFSLAQAAEIDSIRFALDMLRGRGAITGTEFDWGLLALGHAALRVANTTGHFAQFLTPSEKNLTRVSSQFSREVFGEWRNSLFAMKPIGTSDWRRANMATRSDSETLLRKLVRSNDVGVVYCDPPYTDDQYSRFYHVWETLVLYDYPALTGKGRYRPGRFVTDFSLRSKVVDAFRSLIDEVAGTGADIVLSYPSNGLLHEVGGSPLEMLQARYGRAEIVAEVEHSHSTMGASKGPAKASVAERIYVAQAA